MLAGATQILLSVPKNLLRRVAEPIPARGDLRLTRVAPDALVDGCRVYPSRATWTLVNSCLGSREF